MFHKRFAAIIAAAVTLAACAAPPATHTIPVPSAQLGTVAPAYPVGTDLADGVEVLAEIPTGELSTTEPVPLDGTKSCAANIPPEVLTPAGVDPTVVSTDEYGCVWQGSGLSLEIGVLIHPMAEEVEKHVAMADGRSPDQLAHLAWLRVGGHYAIERILKSDESKSCWLSLDLSTTVVVYLVLDSIDSTGNPVESDTETSVRTVCPTARTVALELLDHLDGDAPPWWETVINPTG